MMRTLVSTVVAVALLVSLIPIDVFASEYDRWYSDVPGTHWVFPKVRVLWEEQITDGWIDYFNRALFGPSVDITRGQWAMFVVKAFGMSPLPDGDLIDVASDHREYWNKPAAGYLYAASHHSFIDIEHDRLRPNDFMQRQHAIVSLLKALDLSSAVNALSESQIDTVLARFADARRIQSEYRPHMALAVVLGIMRGYPDRTLRPLSQLTRAEAATLLYRSCVIRVSAEPDLIYPDGDGVAESTTFAAQTLKNRNVTIWTVQIRSADNNSIVYESSQLPHGPSGGPYLVTWDGRVNDRPVKDGMYFYTAYATDRNGRIYSSVTRPLWVSSRDLQLSVQPVYVYPGDTIRVTAVTKGDAFEVYTTDVTTGQELSMTPVLEPPQAGQNTWRAEFTVPEEQRPGQHEIEAHALFSGTERLAVTSYYVVSSDELFAQVSPTACRPGEPYVVSVQTKGQVSRVNLLTPWGRNVRLRPATHGLYLFSDLVPEDSDLGQHVFTVRAEFVHGTKTTDLVLTVLGSGLSLTDLTYVLTD